MPEFSDQHLIDALARKLGAEPASTNGNHKKQESFLSDEQVIGLCRKAKNAAKFATLFDDGDASSYASTATFKMVEPKPGNRSAQRNLSHPWR